MDNIEPNQPVTSPMPEVGPPMAGATAAALRAAGAAIVPMQSAGAGGGEPISEAAPVQTGEGSQVPGISQEGVLGALEGGETREQIAGQLGILPEQISDNLYARMTELARSRTASAGEVERLKRENDTLLAIAQNQPSKLQQQQAAPVPGNWTSAKLELGEDASEEDMLAAAVLERIAPVINAGQLAAGKELLGTVAPFLKKNLETQVESQWNELEPILKQTFGVTRAEVEPYIVQLQQQDPNRPLRGMAFDVAANLLQKTPRKPTVPTVSSPGAGRNAPAQAPPKEEAQGGTFAELLRQQNTKHGQHSVIGAHLVNTMGRQHNR